MIFNTGLVEYRWLNMGLSDKFADISLVSVSNVTGAWCVVQASFDSTACRKWHRLTMLLIVARCEFNSGSCSIISLTAHITAGSHARAAVPLLCLVLDATVHEWDKWTLSSVATTVQPAPLQTVVTCRGWVYFGAVSRVYVTSHFSFVACKADLTKDASELCRDSDFLSVLRCLLLPGNWFHSEDWNFAVL